MAPSDWAKYILMNLLSLNVTVRWTDGFCVTSFNIFDADATFKSKSWVETFEKIFKMISIGKSKRFLLDVTSLMCDDVTRFMFDNDTGFMFVVVTGFRCSDVTWLMCADVNEWTSEGISGSADDSAPGLISDGISVNGLLAWVIVLFHFWHHRKDGAAFDYDDDLESICDQAIAFSVLDRLSI